jgi:hypothetical protein
VGKAKEEFSEAIAKAVAAASKYAKVVGIRIRAAATGPASRKLIARGLAAIEEPIRAVLNSLTRARHRITPPAAKKWIPAYPQGLSPAEHPEAFSPNRDAYPAANREAARLTEYHPWLGSDPDPAEWFITDTGPSVWRVIGQFAVELGLDSPSGYRKLLSGDIDPKVIETVATYYDVPVEAIQTALKYARQNVDAITARLSTDRSALPDATPAS